MLLNFVHNQEPPANTPTKRDSSGNAVNSSKNAHQPTTAAAAATAVAQAFAESDKKKSKEYKNSKKKKFVRAAGGQTWEDESLLEWDPGICIFL